MKKLFLVEVEPASFEMFVWAEGRDEALTLARDNASEEADNVGFDCYCSISASNVALEDVPEEYQDSLPYGEEDSTIAELLTPPAPVAPPVQS